MRKGEFDNEMSPAPRERKTKNAGEALESLMRLCARGERSTGDALRLMRTWGVAECEHQSILDTLIAQRFIDNRRYAEAYVREKSRLSGWGARKIEYQLRLKGVEREIIKEALSQLDSQEVCSRLMERLQRKLRATKAASTFELRGKLVRYGISLGYDYDLVIDAVNEMVRE